MWSCDEAEIGNPGARHKTPWISDAIIGQGICRSCDVLFNSSAQGAFLWYVSPERLPSMEIRGLSSERIKSTTHIWGCLVLTSIVLPIYQSGTVTYVSPDNDLLDVSHMGSVKKQPFVNGRICGKLGTERGPE